MSRHLCPGQFTDYSGLIVVTLLEVVFIDVLINSFGVDPTEFVVLVILVEMLANLGFVREGVRTVGAVGH